VQAIAVSYWRDRNRDVDFVLRGGKTITAIEVKSGRVRDAFPGLSAFAAAVPKARKLLVGSDGVTVEEFLRPAGTVLDDRSARPSSTGTVCGGPLTSGNRPDAGRGAALALPASTLRNHRKLSSSMRSESNRSIFVASAQRPSRDTVMCPKLPGIRNPSRPTRATR
jgi:hypothetical protein